MSAALLAFALAAAPARAGDAADRARRLAWAARKTQAMVERQALLSARYDFSRTEGPLARATTGFPYPPLPHPAPEPGHFVFPSFYGQLHPELVRVDADFDLPDSVLPAYPPPLYLVTRPDLGDVAKGNEISPYNYKALLDGILTPQELEGLRLMLLPRNTLWFNRSEHRVTEKPAHGVSCFSCHVNGHTNGAVLLEPSARPASARVRVDTPSLRGAAQARLLAFKRALPSLPQFVAVEDYFEGETELAEHLGALKLKPDEISAIASFIALIDFPPAPKLGPDARLDRSRASPAELRGEALFFGKARCASCHPAPTYSDDQMHDLVVERLSGGRREGAFKTPALRGLKDSPPYLHDGRLPTVEDAIVFFDLVLKLELAPAEKRDLAAFLRAL